MEQTFNVGLAVKHGVREAIVEDYLRKLLLSNFLSGAPLVGGKRWIFLTDEDISLHFSYWKTKEIKRIIKSLVTKEILRVDVIDESCGMRAYTLHDMN